MFKNNRTSFWNFLGTGQERLAFTTLRHAAEHQGEIITRCPISHVKKTTVNNITYYIKTYYRNGKGVRHYFGRGRIRGEWENLLYFQQLGIPTPRLVAYGQHCKFGQFKQGILITEEVKSHDLATLAKTEHSLFNNPVWLNSVIKQCANYTKQLHDRGFVHWDLKWRNILISNDDEPLVYFFDCPLGRKRYSWLRKRGIIKDLACLDKIGRNVLTRTQRLKFFKLHQGIHRLDCTHKRCIKKILDFFANKNNH